jgi:hypothetical protein
MENKDCGDFGWDAQDYRGTAYPGVALGYHLRLVVVQGQQSGCPLAKFFFPVPKRFGQIIPLPDGQGLHFFKWPGEILLNGIADLDHTHDMVRNFVNFIGRPLHAPMRLQVGRFTLRLLARFPGVLLDFLHRKPGQLTQGGEIFCAHYRVEFIFFTSPARRFLSENQMIPAAPQQ